MPKNQTAYQKLYNQKLRENPAFKSKEAEVKREKYNKDIEASRQMERVKKQIQRLKQKFGEFKVLHIMNLPKDEFTDQDLENMFQKFENIENILLLQGIGCVKFRNHDDAKKAISELDNRLIGQKRIYLTPKNPFKIVGCHTDVPCM